MKSPPHSNKATSVFIHSLYEVKLQVSWRNSAVDRCFHNEVMYLMLPPYSFA